MGFSEVIKLSYSALERIVSSQKFIDGKEAATNICMLIKHLLVLVVIKVNLHYILLIILNMDQAIL